MVTLSQNSLGLTGCGCCRIGIPSMVMGGRGSDSYVAAHVESPAVVSVTGVLAG